MSYTNISLPKNISKVNLGMAKQIKDLVLSVLPTESWKIKLLINWPTIVGDLKKHVTLEKIDEHSLVLGAFNSSWMNELYLLSPILIANINKHLDYPRIKFVRFKIAQVKESKIETTSVKPIQEKKPIFLSTSEQKALSAISDEQLRDSLKKFLIRCKQKD